MDTRRSDNFGYGMNAVKRGLNPCFECGEMTKGLHHVVPVSRGGTKQLPLCAGCHNKAHDAELVQPKLIRDGLAKAVANGKVLGAPIKIGVLTFKVLEMRELGNTYSQIAKALGISTGSVHNAIKGATFRDSNTSEHS